VTPETTMPDWLEPMAATLTQERFAGGDWLFERKFDGIRLLAYKRGADVRLYSRTRRSQDLPDLARAIAGLPVNEVILDGEGTWDGRSGYHVFDILWLNGRDCRSKARCGASSWWRTPGRGSSPAVRAGRG
jgi:ATP-dependent DNA ligase